jgi:hypothetical protein
MSRDRNGVVHVPNSIGHNSSDQIESVQHEASPWYSFGVASCPNPLRPAARLIGARPRDTSSASRAQARTRQPVEPLRGMVASLFREGTLFIFAVVGLARRVRV